MHLVAVMHKCLGACDPKFKHLVPWKLFKQFHPDK